MYQTRNGFGCRWHLYEGIWTSRPLTANSSASAMAALYDGTTTLVAPDMDADDGDHSPQRVEEEEG